VVAARVAVAAEDAGRQANHDERGTYEIENVEYDQVCYDNVLILASLCCVLPMLSMAQAQPATTTATIGPKGFDTPQQAAAAIIKAAVTITFRSCLATGHGADVSPSGLERTTPERYSHPPL